MPIHRYDANGAPVFITQVTANRLPIFDDPFAVELLLDTLRNAKVLHPFQMKAYAFLPDHFHMIIQTIEPETVGTVMHSLKPVFTRVYRAATHADGAAPVWQERFWDHIIRNQSDFNSHVDYVHYNPVRHGYVAIPEAWPHSSFLEWQRRGYYEADWGHAVPKTIEQTLPDDVGE